MHNSLIDVSVVTMIGNLPGIINRNNESINKEFSDVLFSYDENNANPKLKVDVECNYVTAQTGSFQNLNFNGQVLNSSIVQQFNVLDVSVREMQDEIEDIKEYIGMNGTMTYGASRSAANALSENNNSNVTYGSSQSIDDMLDMSGFFTTKTSGVMNNVTEDDLLIRRIYRTVDGVRIPLQIGTVFVDGHIALMLYHDHVTADGASSAQRIYVAVRNNEDMTALIQAAPAHTLMLAR